MEKSKEELAAERIAQIEAEMVAQKRRHEKEAKAKREKLRALKHTLSERRRKERTRTLIEIGGLAEIAGLAAADRGFVLGALLEAAKIDPASTRYQELKAAGDTSLKIRAAEQKAYKKAANQ